MYQDTKLQSQCKELNYNLQSTNTIHKNFHDLPQLRDSKIKSEWLELNTLERRMDPV